MKTRSPHPHPPRQNSPCLGRKIVPGGGEGRPARPGMAQAESPESLPSVGGGRTFFFDPATHLPFRVSYCSAPDLLRQWALTNALPACVVLGKCNRAQKTPARAKKNKQIPDLGAGSRALTPTFFPALGTLPMALVWRGPQGTPPPARNRLLREPPRPAAGCQLGQKRRVGKGLRPAAQTGPIGPLDLSGLRSHRKKFQFLAAVISSSGVSGWGAPPFFGKHPPATPSKRLFYCPGVRSCGPPVFLPPRAVSAVKIGPSHERPIFLLLPSRPSSGAGLASHHPFSRPVALNGPPNLSARPLSSHPPIVFLGRPSWCQMRASFFGPSKAAQRESAWKRSFFPRPGQKSPNNPVPAIPIVWGPRRSNLCLDPLFFARFFSARRGTKPALACRILAPAEISPSIGP